jgi:hypothetical protein
VSAHESRALFWAPRVLCILLIAFVSLFALDVFAEGHGFWKTLVRLLMHLVPSLILTAALMVAWRWEWIGTAAFFACGGFFLMIARGGLAKAMFAAPCFLVAALFYLNWMEKVRSRPTP